MSVITADPMPALVTIPNVELVSVGTWDSLYGPVEFTKADLAAIIKALDDPAIHDPRLRIGHTPASASLEESAGGFSEQPAFGRFRNLRLEDGGATIVADAVGVPAWLAEILPTAFPSRSIEAYWQVTTRNAVHECVVPSVSLLGVSMPACTTLEDLQIAFGAEIPDGVEFTFAKSALATKGATVPETTRASVTYSDVRRSFYDDVATEESGRYWWWLTDLVMSPSTAIADADDGSGTLWSVPYKIGKDDAVTWSDPVEVRVQYLEVKSGKVAAQTPDSTDGYRVEYAAVTDGVRLAAAPSSPVFTAALSRPTDRVRAATTEEGARMNEQQTKLAAKLGLGEDATEEQLNAKLQEDALAAVDTPEEKPVVEETPVTAPLGAIVAPDALAQLQEDARLGREAREAQLTAAREQFVDERLSGGFITPATRAAHLAELEKGGDIEKAHRSYLSSLTSVIVSVKERGTQGDALAGGDGARIPMDRLMESFGHKPRELAPTGRSN